MITEDYVSFETAKLLKEKGFNGECSRFYMPNGNGRWKYGHYHDFDISDRIDCPTLQMAMKWLREVQKIKIEIITYWTKDKNMVYGNRIVHNNASLKEIDTAYISYEQSCESAVKYCLENLI